MWSTSAYTQPTSAKPPPQTNRPPTTTRLRWHDDEHENACVLDVLCVCFVCVLCSRRRSVPCRGLSGCVLFYVLCTRVYVYCSNNQRKSIQNWVNTAGKRGSARLCKQKLMGNKSDVKATTTATTTAAYKRISRPPCRPLLAKPFRTTHTHSLAWNIIHITSSHQRNPTKQRAIATSNQSRACTWKWIHFISN